MSTVYLNGEFLPIEQGRISPLDRGFLFGDGIYEFIPTYSGKAIGFKYHIERMLTGLNKIGIEIGDIDWRSIIDLYVCYSISRRRPILCTVKSYLAWFYE